MKITERKVTIGEVAEGYINDAEEGVTGYDDQLDIRPKYQREFVYKDKQRDEVINTVTKNFPLNVMYWIKNNDGTFEVLDGQQRTISLCASGSFLPCRTPALRNCCLCCRKLRGNEEQQQ